MKCNDCHAQRISNPELPEDQARCRAQECVAYLKYLGLAARTWASNHNSNLPGSFAVMANELQTPVVAACPELSENASALRKQYPNSREAGWKLETAPLAFPTWFNLNQKRVTYQLILPRNWRHNPAADYVRCRIHGNVLHADGSVVPAPFHFTAAPIRLAALQPEKRNKSIPRIARLAGLRLALQRRKTLPNSGAKD